MWVNGDVAGIEVALRPSLHVLITWKERYWAAFIAWHYLARSTGINNGHSGLGVCSLEQDVEGSPEIVSNRCIAKGTQSGSAILLSNVTSEIYFFLNNVLQHPGRPSDLGSLFMLKRYNIAMLFTRNFIEV
jgi:hypothetical protein